MNIRMTPVLALAMALGLAACQDEDSPETTDTSEVEEIGGLEGEATDAGSVAIEEPADEGASADMPAADESAEVEADSTDIEEAGQETMSGATDAAPDGEMSTTGAAEPASDVAGEEGVSGAEASGEESLDELLTPEGFDADRLVEEIDNSGLDETRKEELRELTRSAEEDPSQLDAAIETLREELLEEDGADARDAIGGERDFAAAPGSLFSPEPFGGASTYKVEGARLAGMSTAIFTDESDARVALD